MRVMYWNCTAPYSDNVFAKAKLAIIVARVAQVSPDILCLDEVSLNVNSVATANAWAAGMGLVGYTAKVVSLNPGTHLNMVLFHGAALDKTNSDEGIPDPDWAGEKTKRNLVRTRWNDKQSGRQLSVWFLHANASVAGGKTAVDLALAAIDGTSSVFIGDFNSPVIQAQQTAAGVSKDAFAVAPSSKAVSGAPYSQWSKALTPVNGDPNYKIPGTIFSFTPTPYGCIDFALGRNLITATAVDALAGLSANDYGQLMMNVDHIPIAFDIAAK